MFVIMISISVSISVSISIDIRSISHGKNDGRKCSVGMKECQ